ncbi:hypothetical protein F4604DRAFT_392093 [Suillus subluteus]|nr:hypothetical protein F4604DRAFT_392093 [Suillus subluteus]
MEDCEPLLVETTIIKSSETESIRPITVYQALQAERLANDVQFSLGGAKFDKASHYYLNVSERSNIFKSLKVMLVTHVMLRTSDARGVYDLDDGTGRIYGSRSNTAGQDHAAFSAMIRQFDNSLACVKGKLIQRGQQKIIDIESMIGAGYHQAMYHTLDCMKTSLMVERHKGQVCAYSGFMIDICIPTLRRLTTQTRCLSSKNSKGMRKTRWQPTREHLNNLIVHFLICPRMMKVEMSALLRLLLGRYRGMAIMMRV